MATSTHIINLPAPDTTQPTITTTTMNEINLTYPLHYPHNSITVGHGNPTPTWTSTYNNNRLFHNQYGPAAVTKADVKWYIEGTEYFNTQEFCIAANHDNETTMLWMLSYGDTLPTNHLDIKYLPVELNT